MNRRKKSRKVGKKSKKGSLKLQIPTLSWNVNLKNNFLLYF